MYKRQFTQSNADVAYKAVTAAYDALRAKVATPGTMSQAEKDAAEAAITTMKTVSGEQTRARTALLDAIHDSEADTQYAYFQMDAGLAEMEAVLAECTLEYNTYLKRFDAARLKHNEARAQAQAVFALTNLLMEGVI